MANSEQAAKFTQEVVTFSAQTNSSNTAKDALIANLNKETSQLKQAAAMHTIEIDQVFLNPKP